MTDAASDGKNEARVKEVFDRMDRVSDERHIESDCTVLDNICCIRGWQQLRELEPDLVADVELLHGKDFWLGLSEPLRTLMGVFAHSTEHTEETMRAAAKRGLRKAAAAMDEAKVETIKSARRSRG